MIKREHLLEHVIRPTLVHLNGLNESLVGKAAENLLLGTVLQESAGGKYLQQLGGPALGIFQIEPATHEDVFDSFLKYRPDWENTIIKLASRQFYLAPNDELVFNLRYSCAIARLVYWRAPHPLPHEDNVRGLAEYWKLHFNTVAGAGTVEQFIGNYKMGQ